VFERFGEFWKRREMWKRVEKCLESLRILEEKVFENFENLEESV
jgi:hypothetical protein